MKPENEARAELIRIRAALETMTDGGRAVLVRIARNRTWDFPRAGVSGDAEDVVQEVLKKAWEGTRRCALDVDLTAFFANCIRSIAHQWNQEGYSELAEHSEFRHYQARCSLPSDKGMEIARDIVDAVAHALRDDSDALKVLESLLDEKPPRQAFRECDIHAKNYNTARHRIRRRTRHAAAIAGAGFHRTNFSRRPF